MIADQRADAGETILLQVSAEDPDGNPILYSATGLPDLRSHCLP